VCSRLLVRAKGGRRGSPKRCTRFLEHLASANSLDAPGFSINSILNTMDSNSPGGHAEVEFHDVRVSRDRILGEVGKGFRYAQIRLAPARLTHYMRWLGGARRCHSLASEYARHRQAFGRAISEHQGVGFMLADNEIDINPCRLAIRCAAWLLDQA
jgi:acyl-CoA dehydrogenase